MADDKQQQQGAPDSQTWLKELHEKMLAELPEKFKEENVRSLSEDAQRKLLEDATPEEKEKLVRLQTVIGVFIGLQQGILGVTELDQIKSNFQAAEAGGKDPYKSIEADLQAVITAYAAAQRKPSNASGITQDGAGAPNFDGEDPELDGDSGQGPVSRFMKRFRKKPLNEVLHGHWPGYNPNGIALSQLGEFIDTSRYNDKVDKTGNLHFKVKDGGTICWRPGSDKQPEFIGRTNLQSRFGKKPLKEADANAIMSIAKVRGWKSINLHGTAQEKNELWLAAMKQGIHVPESNFIPSDEYRAKWENYQKSSGFENKGFAGVSETPQAQTVDNNLAASAPANTAAPEADKTAKGPAKGTKADAAQGPAAPAKGSAAKTRFSQTGDEPPTAKAEDDTAPKAPKADRGGKGRQP